MNKTWLVAKETYRREVKNWSFLLMIFAPFIVLIISFFFGMSSSSAFDDNTKVGIVSQNEGLVQPLKKTKDFDMYKNKTKAEKAYQAGDISGYIVVENTSAQLEATYYSTERLDSDLKEELMRGLNAQQQVLNLKNAKLSEQQLKSLSQKVKFTEKTNSKKLDANDEKNLKTATFWILIFVLYFLVQTYSTIMAQDIASEKGTKIMEMIFSSMPGGDYFTGKILGIFGEIITQVLIYVIGFAAVYCAAPYIDGFSDLFDKYKPMIDQTVGNLASWGLLFTIIGLVLFIIFAAFCGALVAKSENANKAVGPLTTLMLIGFLFTLDMQSSGDTIFAKVLSYIPFLSSFVMPARVIMGSATNLEAAISALIALVAAVASFIWIRKIYPNLILQTDDVGPWQNFKRSLL